jgi:cation transport protein ChaC
MDIPAENASTHWVFGYGSLIWHPGFTFVRSQTATLRGAHRSLSVYSHHYRGTLEKPGLVFGLSRGGSCRGMAFEVDADHWEEAHAYLRARELVTDVYREVFRPVRLDSGAVVMSMAYVVDEQHIQYAGRLPIEDQVAMVRSGFGISGSNVEYVLNTAQHLAQMGIRDKTLDKLAALLGEPLAEAV